MEIDLEILAKATSEIDGGCCHCICEFLNALKLEDATKIAVWINKNNPLYGGDERLIYVKGKYTAGWVSE